MPPPSLFSLMQRTRMLSAFISPICSYFVATTSRPSFATRTFHLRVARVVFDDLRIPSRHGPPTCRTTGQVVIHGASPSFWIKPFGTRLMIWRLTSALADMDTSWCGTSMHVLSTLFTSVIRRVHLDKNSMARDSLHLKQALEIFLSFS